MRVLLLLILLLVFVVINPTARERVAPHVQPVLNPVYEWSANSRLSELARLIREEESTGRSVRSNAELNAIVRREYGRRGEDAHLDPWGNPYYLTPVRGGFTVTSAGRDGVRETEWDLHSDTIRILLR